MNLRNCSGSKLACVFISAFILSACGSNGSDDGGNGGLPAGFGGFDGFADDEECVPVDASCYVDLNTSLTIDQFDARWLSGCERLEEYDGKYSDDAAFRVESVLISGRTGSRTNNYYTDSSCATPASTSEVASDLELFYAAAFTVNTVGVDNVVLVNLKASNLSFDSGTPTAEQAEEITRSRAERTFYTSMQRIDSALHIGKPSGFTDGQNRDDRILSPFDESGFSSNPLGITYTQQ